MLLNQKGFSAILLLVGLLMLGGGIGGGIYLFAREKTAENSLHIDLLQPSQMNSVIPSPIETQWPTYNDEELGLSLNYPPVWYIADGMKILNSPDVIRSVFFNDKPEIGKLERLVEVNVYKTSFFETTQALTYKDQNSEVEVEATDIIVLDRNALKVVAKKVIINGKDILAEDPGMESSYFVPWNSYTLEINYNKKVEGEVKKMLDSLKVLDTAEILNDIKRIKEISSLQNAINVSFQVSTLDIQKYNIGCEGESYSSICSGSSLTDSKLANGSGWIKMDLTKQQAVIINELPLDPVNDANYHFVFCSDKNLWEINTKLESSKYASKMASDGGDDPNKYEVGSNLNLIDQNPNCKY